MAPLTGWRRSRAWRLEETPRPESSIVLPLVITAGCATPPTPSRRPSMAAWANFLVFGAPHEPLPVQEMGGDWWHGQPIMVAGRSVGVHGSVDAADRILGLLAYEAIGLASPVVGLATGTISEYAVTQSCVVACIAVVLSAAWWLAVGNALSAFRRRCRERRAVVPATTL